MAETTAIRRNWFVLAALGAAAAALVAVAMTGDTDTTIRGVVIDVDGGITDVEAFVLRLEDGTDRRMVPQRGIRFAGSAPIGHLRDHLLSGDAVEVRISEAEDGTLIALDVRDAG